MQSYFQFAVSQCRPSVFRTSQHPMRQHGGQGRTCLESLSRGCPVVQNLREDICLRESGAVGILEKTPALLYRFTESSLDSHICRPCCHLSPLPLLDCSSSVAICSRLRNSEYWPRVSNSIQIDMATETGSIAADSSLTHDGRDGAVGSSCRSGQSSTPNSFLILHMHVTSHGWLFRDADMLPA